MWTNPQFHAAVDDSGNTYCEVAADTCRDLGSIEVWGQPSYGGVATILTTVPAMQREGLVDSVQVDRIWNWAGWHYWVIPVDMAGRRGCPSNVVFVPGSQVTGVPDEPIDPIVERRYFDVRGRKVTPKAKGVYWLVEVRKSGATSKPRKIVWLRPID